METLRAIGIFLLAIGAVFGIAFWQDRRAKSKKKDSCCS
jgi:hypothetical protein